MSKTTAVIARFRSMKFSLPASLPARRYCNTNRAPRLLTHSRNQRQAGCPSRMRSGQARATFSPRFFVNCEAIHFECPREAQRHPVELCPPQNSANTRPGFRSAGVPPAPLFVNSEGIRPERFSRRVAPVYPDKGRGSACPEERRPRSFDFSFPQRRRRGRS